MESLDYSVARKRMVQDQLFSRGITNKKILQLMYSMPRHLFTDAGMAPLAYNDHPLSIGEGQTISQPYIVAYMLETLELKPSDKVLEVGMGSGYQTALLAELVGQVYAIERIKSLLFKARKVLKDRGYKNIHLLGGDGTQGAKKYAPFDAIIVAAAGPKIPQPYLDQLNEGGRLILPVGTVETQELVLVKKQRGRFLQKTLSGCRFVKLKGRHGFEVE